MFNYFRNRVPFKPVLAGRGTTYLVSYTEYLFCVSLLWSYLIMV